MYSSWAQSRQPVVALSNESPSYQAYTNCTIVPRPGEKIQDGIIIIKNGVITGIGTEIDIPKEAVVKDLEGAWVYPAFIDAYTHYGLKPVKRAPWRGAAGPQYHTKKVGPYYWNQAVRPEYEVIQDFKPNKEVAKGMRGLGFACANVVPNDGIFRGEGMLVSLGEGGLKTELIAEESCMGMSFSKGSSSQAYPSSLMGSMALIRQTILDADWYEKAAKVYEKNPKQKGFEPNISLEEAVDQLNSRIPIFFETSSYLNTLRASELAKEFKLDLIYKTTGDEYKRINSFKGTGASFVVPLNFPKAYDVKDNSDARSISLGKMKEWEQAPGNPAALAKMGIPFAITTSDLKKPQKAFWANLRKAVAYGLSEADALEALTLEPARMLGVESKLGSLGKGKAANMVIASGNLFGRQGKIYETVIGGKSYKVSPRVEIDVRGKYALNLGGKTLDLTLKGESPAFKVEVKEGSTEYPATVSVTGAQVTLAFADKKTHWRLKGIFDEDRIMGTAIDPKGERFRFKARKTEPAGTNKAPKLSDVGNPADVAAVTFPNKAYGWETLPEDKTYFLQGATIWSNTDKGKFVGDVIISRGKISGVGTTLDAPQNAEVIEATGMHLTPGIIDEHSHIAISQGVNEGTHSISAEVRIGDVINPDDINIYRQLAGGVTTAQLLHGSANPIGGQSAIIKMRWGSTAEGMKFENAPGFIKFALGENVKQSNWGNAYRSRYPQTRMGVEQMMKDGFLSAKDYRKLKSDYRKFGHKVSPATDLQLETLLEILDGDRNITCHSYVQSEITMLMRLAEELGFKINTFTHILEGYKVADKMKAHGANASTFSDWWAYKYEVIDAIPYNAALLYEQGVTTCINSDDAEMGRRLNQEAAKAVKYGNVPEEEALKMVTLNPAKVLGLDKWVGSIENGKHGDVVLWSENPLSIYAKAMYTFIDGKLYFDHKRDKEMREDIQAERSRLINKMISDKGAKQPKENGMRAPRHYHCDDIDHNYDILD